MVEDTKNAASSSAQNREAFVHKVLEPEPSWVIYDSELERLCRVAASVGGEQEAPISYTALVIAFLFGEDNVSKWFQSYVGARGIRLAEIFRSKNTSDKDRDRHVSRAD